MDFGHTGSQHRKKQILIGLVGVVIACVAAAAIYFFYKYDQASQPQVEVSSGGDQKDNGSGIALPGLDDSGQTPLGTPTGDSSGNSVALNGGTSSPQQQQSSNQSSQQQKPVRSQTLDNGLKIDEFSYGTGDRATKVGDTLAMHYIGYLADGKVFDTSLKGEKKPFVFKLGAGQVIPGWDIGLQDMHVGAVRRLVIPASLAYGARGYPPTIPPNATLTFDVQLMGIQ